ncbi:gamma-glutamyl-gamma-aminobutyrate hydrolase family protein [Pseudomonas frederiksbergensis]|uniref:gamma-glutamyl-gamma-aminobutyrate hydrolase family protein n=1 Tax=Pseudomonas frederiksbergensis TaxID=104087 RepID=UPI003D1A75EF
MSRLPLIGVTICSGQIGLHAHHISGDRCVHTKAQVAKGVSSTLLSPAAFAPPSDILDAPHDILFTASVSNIEPFYFSGPANASSPAHDSARPATLSITHALAAAGICARPLQWQSVSRDADASNNA